MAVLLGLVLVALLWWALLTWPLQSVGVLTAGLVAVVLCEIRRELRQPDPLGEVRPSWRRERE